MHLEQLIIDLPGKTVDKVVDHDEHGSDCGMTIYFTDGTFISWGYSGCEGTTWCNGEEIPELS